MRQDATMKWQGVEQMRGPYLETFSGTFSASIGITANSALLWFPPRPPLLEKPT
jgi:hypothetical protein